MHKFLIAAAFSTVAGAAGFAGAGSFSTLPPSLTSINASAPRYTTEDERLVSEIAGSILNIAAFADHFEMGDAFQVRNLSASTQLAKYSLARRAEVFTVEVPGRVWAPAGYVALARSFMADGAGLSISEDSARDHADAGTLIAATPDALRIQNVRLSRLLQEHPRSAAIHERAAMLLGAVATRQAAAGDDVRPLLSRMTAHLAVARALHEGPSLDGALAERMLSALAVKESKATRAPEGPWVDGPVIFGDRPQVEIVPASPGGGPQQ